MINIEENLPHEIAELICLKCLNRAIYVYPSSVLLKDLECKCGEVGYLIKTGQTLDDPDSADAECESCDLFENGKCKLGLHNDERYYCGYWKGREER